jgi:Uma2 family endonuclease
MSTTTQPLAAPPIGDLDVPDVPIYRLTVEQYRAMARAGILDEDDPVELLEGWLVQKMTKNRPHSIVTGLIQDALIDLLPTGWHVTIQDPITTSDSEPEPDIAVVRGKRRDYQDHPPGPPSIALVVEVAETSLRQDQGHKKRIYARAGIPVYWIANLVESKFEVYTDPASAADPPGYGQRRDYGPADTIPVVLDGVEVGSLPVQAVLP